MSEIHTYDPRFSAINRMQKNGKNASTMFQDNRNLILQLVRKNGAVSRKQLSEISGLQLATVTIIIRELMEQGLIQENGMVDGGNGRCVKSFSMVPDIYTIAIRLTGVYVKVALFDIHLQPLYVEKIFFQTKDYVNEAIDLIEKHVLEIEKIVDKKKILSLNIGVEHLYRLIGYDYSIWDSYKEEYCPIGKVIYNKLKYKVFVNRAINYSSYDIWDRYMKMEESEDIYATLVCIQLSYDLEGAIIVNRELLYGMEGLCGQLREIRIDRNSDKTYKDVVTVPALLKRAKELLEEYPDSCISEKAEVNIRDIIAGYSEGDELCNKVYDEVAGYLGYIFAQILNWFDPDRILLEDEIPTDRKFMETLQREVARYSNEEKAERVGTLLDKRITQNDPVLVGGAKYAFDLQISDIGIY